MSDAIFFALAAVAFASSTTVVIITLTWGNCSDCGEPVPPKTLRCGPCDEDASS